MMGLLLHCVGSDDDALAFEQRLEDDGPDDVVLPEPIHLARDIWEAMGRPEQISVTLAGLSPQSFAAASAGQSHDTRLIDLLRSELAAVRQRLLLVESRALAVVARGPVTDPWVLRLKSALETKSASRIAELTRQQLKATHGLESLVDEMVLSLPDTGSLDALLDRLVMVRSGQRGLAEQMASAASEIEEGS